MDWNAQVAARVASGRRLAVGWRRAAPQLASTPWRARRKPRHCARRSSRALP